MLDYTDDPKYRRATFAEIMQLDLETQPKFLNMEHVFWVKLTDFMDIVPHIPHLHGLELEFLNMHLDPEPLGQSITPHFNGRAPEVAVKTSDSYIPNGVGHPRPGT